jgi:hypothetical protein
VAVEGETGLARALKHSLEKQRLHIPRPELGERRIHWSRAVRNPTLFLLFLEMAFVRP